MKRDQRAQKKQLLYGNFVKSATLDNGIEEAEEKSDDDSDESDATDEPIKAFGGNVSVKYIYLGVACFSEYGNIHDLSKCL